MAAMSPQSALNRAAICAAVISADRALTAPEILAQVQAMGHDSGQTSQHLFRLRTAGVLERVDGGKGRTQCYDVGDADEARRIAAELAPAPATASPATETRAPRARKTKAAAKRAPIRRKATAKTASTAISPIPINGNGHRIERDGEQPPLFDYAVSTKGDIQIVRADGEGEPAVLPRREALRLAAFIEMAKPIMDRAKELSAEPA